MNVIESFSKQLVGCKPVEDAYKLKGYGVYGSYQHGDIILYFLDYSDIEKGAVKLSSVTQRELFQLNEEYIVFDEDMNQFSFPKLRKIK